VKSGSFSDIEVKSTATSSFKGKVDANQLTAQLEKFREELMTDVRQEIEAATRKILEGILIISCLPVWMVDNIMQPDKLALTSVPGVEQK
jgi:hypothetical protein